MIQKFHFIGIYLKGTKSPCRKDICTLMFTAAFFTTGSVCKQPKGPRIDEWMKTLRYMRTMESCKKGGHGAICWRLYRLESEMSQRERDGQRMCSLSYAGCEDAAKDSRL